MHNCQAVRERAELTLQLAHAMGFSTAVHAAKDPRLGTEVMLNEQFAVLKGVVAEYQDGGDQMVENCTCGQHIDDKLAGPSQEIAERN